MRKHVVLFDMDGTITPARKSINQDMISALKTLTDYANIGIVSGSDFEYIYEQCGKEFIQQNLSENIDILPCNGTKYYTFIKAYLERKEYKKVFSKSMIEEIGEDYFRDLISGICQAQAQIVQRVKIPVTGNFISYRDSTINWSLIGRQSTQKQRSFFSNHPQKDLIRKDAIQSMWAYTHLDDLNSKIEVSLAGQTSIDIYPKDWDKTYALKYFPGKKVWFVGDCCEEGGGDYHIYKELCKTKSAYATTGPEETIEIIDHIIEMIKKY